MLGAASASVQLSRSVGSAIGVTVAMGCCSWRWPENATIADVFRRAPFDQVLPPWRACQKRRALRRSPHIQGGFSAAFSTIALFAIANAVLAWTLPVRRL